MNSCGNTIERGGDEKYFHAGELYQFGDKVPCISLRFRNVGVSISKKAPDWMLKAHFEDVLIVFQLSILAGK
jgi:hypothetical protein